MAQTRFRIPDVCLVRRDLPREQIIRHPPLACIEVLNPEDRMRRTMERVKDYCAMGVANIWIVDPASRQGWVCREGSLASAARFEVPATPIHLDLAALFRELD